MAGSPADAQCAVRYPGTVNVDLGPKAAAGSYTCVLTTADGTKTERKVVVVDY